MEITQSHFLGAHNALGCYMRKFKLYDHLNLRLGKNSLLETVVELYKLYFRSFDSLRVQGFTSSTTRGNSVVHHQCQRQ